MIFESDDRYTSVWPMPLAVAGSVLLHAGLFAAWPTEAPVQEERLPQQAIEVTLADAIAPPEVPAPPAAAEAGIDRPQGSIDLVQTAPAPGPRDAAIPLQPAPSPSEASLRASLAVPSGEPGPALEDSVTLAEAPPAVVPRELVPTAATDARSQDLLDRVQAPPTPQPVRQAPPRPELGHQGVAVATLSRPGAPARLSDAGSYASQQQAQQDYVLMVVRKLSHRQFYARGDRSSAAAGGVVVARLTVGRDGALVDLSLAKDSGSASLDSSVLDAVRKAAPFAPLPQGFARNTFTFIVPINYAQER